MGINISHLVAQDMLEINHQLDALRAMAYAQGVSPIFSELDDPQLDPSYTKEQLVEALGSAYGRMDHLQYVRVPGILDQDLRQRCEWLVNEIQHQCVKLHHAGFLQDGELPKHIHKIEGEQSLEAIGSYYNDKIAKAVPLPDSSKSATIVQDSLAESSAAEPDLSKEPKPARFADLVRTDLAETTMLLDVLRGKAYASGVTPIFSDEDVTPSETAVSREDLVQFIGNGFLRLDTIRQLHEPELLDAETRHAAERLSQDILYQFNRLNEAGYIGDKEMPRHRQQQEGIWLPKDVAEYYENSYLGDEPAAQIDTDGLAYEPPVATHKSR